MHTKQFCHVFAVAIDVVDFCCDFFFHQILVFFFICSLFSPFLFCSFFRSFHILYSDINESLIEQKITSVQSDAYFKEPVDKKLVYMFDAKLKWIEWAANSYPFLESVRVPRVYRNMRRKKKKRKKLPVPSTQILLQNFYQISGASFAAGYERKLNNFQCNGYSNTSLCQCLWIQSNVVHENIQPAWLDRMQ